MKLLFAGDAVIQDAGAFSLSKELQGLIEQADCSIVNFEGSLKGANSFPIKKVGPNVFNCDGAASLLQNAGFGVFTLANNHIVDFGADSCIQTIRVVQDLGVKTVGAGASYDDCYAPLLLENDGQKIAVINCCHAEFGVYKDKNIPLKAGYAWINAPIIDKKIMECKKNGCFVIVVAHAGVENIPLPLPEWRERYKRFVDIGADLVIGGHPHIIQGHESCNGKNIFYSLGNFYFPNKERADDFEWNHGMLVAFDTKTLDYNVYFTEPKDGQLCLCGDQSVKKAFENRSKILKDDKDYYKEINAIVCDLWTKTYKPLYEAVPNFINCRKNLFVNLLKHFAKKFLFRGRYQKDLNQTLLLHNIQIESHRYAVERYLYLQNVKVNNLGE